MKIEIKEKIINLTDGKSFTRYYLYINGMFVCACDKYNRVAFTYLRGMLSNKEKGDENYGIDD